MATEKMRGQILAFAKDNSQVPELSFINKDPVGCIIQPTGDEGRVNYIYRVKSKDGTKSVILKYGESTMKAIGDGEELSLDRQRREYYGLSIWQSLLPNQCVKAYCYDARHNIIAMEDLGKMDIMAQAIRIGTFDTSIASAVGKILGQLSRLSSGEKTAPDLWEERKKLMGFENNEFASQMFLRILDRNDPLITLSKETLPMFNKMVEGIRNAGVVEKIKEVFCRRDCLVHGDCHSNAVFVQGDSIKFFDFEFAMIGPSTMDISCMAMSSYIVLCCEAVANTGGNASVMRRQAAKAFTAMIEAYMGERDDIQKAAQKEEILREIALMCAVKYAFTVNLTGIEDQVRLTEKDKIYMMEIALDLFINYRDITSIELLTKANFPELK